MLEIILKILFTVFPEKIINNHGYAINKFITDNAQKINKKNIKVLDIGAGELPYKKYFSKCTYLSQDVVNNKFGTIDYVCDAVNIPLKSGSIDFIICTQVMEHIKEPFETIKEMGRLLKKNGKIFLTTHLCMEEHMIPYDYFRYTRYGLEYLAVKSSLKVESIKAEGGRFLVLGKQLQTAVPRILPNKSLVYLYYLIFIIPIFFMHLILYFLDKLDKDKHLTTNYECIFVK